MIGQIFRNNRQSRTNMLVLGVFLVCFIDCTSATAWMNRFKQYFPASVEARKFTKMQLYAAPVVVSPHELVVAAEKVSNPSNRQLT